MLFSRLDMYLNRSISILNFFSQSLSFIGILCTYDTRIIKKFRSEDEDKKLDKFSIIYRK